MDKLASAPSQDLKATAGHDLSWGAWQAISANGVRKSEVTPRLIRRHSRLFSSVGLLLTFSIIMPSAYAHCDRSQVTSGRLLKRNTLSGLPQLMRHSLPAGPSDNYWPGCSTRNDTSVLPGLSLGARERNDSSAKHEVAAIDIKANEMGTTAVTGAVSTSNEILSCNSSTEMTVITRSLDFTYITLVETFTAPAYVVSAEGGAHTASATTTLTESIPTSETDTSYSTTVFYTDTYGQTSTATSQTFEPTCVFESENETNGPTYVTITCDAVVTDRAKLAVSVKSDSNDGPIEISAGATATTTFTEEMTTIKGDMTTVTIPLEALGIYSTSKLPEGEGATIDMSGWIVGVCLVLTALL